MRTSYSAPLLILLAACAAIPPAESTVPAPPDGAAIGSAAALRGTFRVAGIDDRELDLPFGLAVAITAEEIEFDAPCGAYAWRYTLDAGALQLSRTREPAASCLATARIHHAVFDTAAAIEAARRAERTPANAVRLSGGGRSVELYTH